MLDDRDPWSQAANLSLAMGEAGRAQCKDMGIMLLGAAVLVGSLAAVLEIPFKTLQLLVHKAYEEARLESLRQDQEAPDGE